VSLKGILIMVERISKERVTVTACNAIGLPNSPIIYWEEWKPLLL
jgi:hypothetical protein